MVGYMFGYVFVICIDDLGRYIMFVGDVIDFFEQFYVKRVDVVGLDFKVYIVMLEIILVHCA